MMPSARQFKDHLKETLQENTKTTWEKEELQLSIEELYSNFIERFLED